MNFLKKHRFVFIFLMTGVLFLAFAGCMPNADKENYVAENANISVTQKIEVTKEMTSAPTEEPTMTATEQPSATLEPTDAPETKTITLMDGETIQVPIDAMYCGSKRSEVFHYIYCDSVSDIKKSNFVLYDSVDDAKAKGKRPCKRCEP